MVFFLPLVESLTNCFAAVGLICGWVDQMEIGTSCAYDRMRVEAAKISVLLKIKSGFHTFSRQVNQWQCYKKKGPPKCDPGKTPVKPGMFGTSVVTYLLPGGY